MHVNFLRVNTDDEYGTKFHSDFEVTKNNRIYIIMCKLGERLGSGCFNTRKMSVETHISKKSDNMLLNNFKFFVNNQKVNKPWMYKKLRLSCYLFEVCTQSIILAYNENDVINLIF